MRGAHAQGTRAVLVNFQEHRLARFFPVQVHVDHMRVLPHLVSHFTRQRAGLLDVFAGHPELHRVAHRRAVFQARNAGAQVGELLVHDADQPATQALAVFHRLGQHHELGKAGGRQLLVQRQVEAWRASAHIGHVVVDTVLLLEQRLQLFDPLGGIGQRSTFSQLQVNHQLRAPGGREELLGHETEQQDAADKSGDGQQNHGFAPPHTPLHHSPYTLVERRGVRVWRVAVLAVACGMQLGQIWQQALAQVRHEHHRRHP